MRISQILITDNDNLPLSGFLLGAMQNIKNSYPDSDYRLYRKKDLQEFIFSTYGEEILKAFNKLRPYAYKSDFARYLLLYAYGGWYFDSSIRILNPVSVSQEVDLVAFVDPPQYTGTSFACNQAVVYSSAKNKVLEDCITSVLENCKREYYGINALSPSGPIVFGKAIAKFGENIKNVIGTFLDLTPNFPNKNRAYVFNDGSIFALHKPGNIGGDLSYLGISGSNNYGEMYRLREVYDSEIVFDYTGPHA